MISISVAVLLAVTMTACDSGKSSGRPGASRAAGSSSPASLTPAAAAERDALAAYRGMWDAWVEAGKTSNPDEPALRTFASAEALKLIVGSLATNQHNQEVAQGEPVISPRVVEAKPTEAPTQATISDCVNDENWLMYKASGGLVNDVPGGRHNMTATVTLADGVWKVSHFKLGKVGTC